MTNTKRCNQFAILFDNFAGLSEQDNADLSKLVISATRVLYQWGMQEHGSISFANDVNNVALSKIWEQLARQLADKDSSSFRLTMHDVTTKGTRISSVMFGRCHLDRIELTPLDNHMPDTQRIEVSYRYMDIDAQMDNSSPD